MNVNFCYVCGGNLKKEAYNLLICQKCGHHLYINAKPCNAIILENSQGEILLVKRKFPPSKGLWDLPGGFVDLGETLEGSLVREIREEIGVKLENFHYFKSYSDIYPYQGVDYPTLGAVFTGKIKDQTLKPSSDISEIKFFPKNKIPFEKLAFKSLNQALKNYLLKERD